MNWKARVDDSSIPETLRSDEAMIRTWAARIGSIPIRLNMSPIQTATGGTAGANGNGAAGQFGNRPELNEFFSNLRFAGYDIKQSVARFREYVDEFGDALQNAASQISQAGSASTSSGGSQPTMSGGSIPGGGGGMLARYRATVFAFMAVRNAVQDIQAYRREGNLGNEFSGQDSLAQGKELERMGVEEQSSLTGWLRRNSTINQSLYGDSDQNLSNLQSANREGVRADERVKRVKDAIRLQRENDVKIAELTQGGAAGQREALEQWKQDQEKLASALELGGDKKAAAEARSQTAIIAAQESAKIVNEAMASENESTQAIRESAQSAHAAELRGDNRGQESEINARKNAIYNRNMKAFNAYDATTVGTPEAKLRWAEYRATEAAGEIESDAIDKEDARQRGFEAMSSQDAITDVGQQTWISNLRGSNQPRAAALQSQIDAINRKVRSAKEAIDKADDRDKPMRQAEYDAINKSSGIEIADLQSEDARRQSNEAFDYSRRASLAALSTTPGDFEGQIKAATEDWNHRIANMEPGDIEARKQAAARDAEIGAIQTRQQRSGDSLQEQARSGSLRAARQGGLADVEDAFQDIKDELVQAGGDQGQQRAIINRGRARLQQMATAGMRSGVFSSYGEFGDAIQQSVFEGTGPAQAQLQQIFQALGKAENGDMSNLFGPNGPLNQAGDKLNQAADKIINSSANIFILRDN